MRSSARVGVVLVLQALSACTGATGIAKGPYLQNATVSGITVCWVSEVPCKGAVSYRPEGAGSARAGTVKESKPVIYHKVHLVGLRPHTSYHYTVTCESKTADEVFRTAALPSQAFKFAAYGDNRTQPQVHASIISRMMSFAPDFVVQSGDLVANGENESQWEEFWEVVRPLVCTTPYYPALGNHEKGGAPYYQYFEVKREYSFDYGNAHFVALDSNKLPSEYAAQEEWLRRDLAAHQEAKWRIVFFHHTIHTCVDKPGRRAESILRAERFEPIFAEGHVQLVINGHDHDYQRHLAHGITYVVTGGGGAPLYDVTPDTPYVQKAEKAHHYCEIRVDGGKMSVQAVKPDGGIIERFELRAQ